MREGLSPLIRYVRDGFKHQPMCIGNISTNMAHSITTRRAASFTNTKLNPVTGQPFVLTWCNAKGSVDIVLRFGDPSNLVTVQTLAGMAFSNASPAAETRITPSGADPPLRLHIGNLTGNSTTVTLDVELPPGNYAFEIVDGSSSKFSALFAIEGNGGEKKSPTPANAPQPSSTTTNGEKEIPKPESTDKENTDTSTAAESDSTSANPFSISNSGSGSKPSESSSTSGYVTDSTSASSKDTVGNSDGSGNGTSRGLSTGAKAGIGVGVGVAGLVTLCSLGSSSTGAVRPLERRYQGSLLAQGGVAEFGIEEKKIPELGGQPRAEVMGDSRGHARELETGTQEEEKSLKRHELP